MCGLRQHRDMKRIGTIVWILHAFFDELDAFRVVDHVVLPGWDGVVTSQGVEVQNEDVQFRG